MSDGYHGWLYFKNEQTQERLACPAAAVERHRGRSGSRMALVFKSPVTGEVGEWDELRHGVWASKRVEEARQWSPVSFFIQDPAAREPLERAVAASLADLPTPPTQEISAERRARRIRMDDWARGWALDLVWDPFHNLEVNSHAKIIALQNEGVLPAPSPESAITAWLDQEPVVQSPAIAAPATPAPAAPVALSESAEASPFGAEPPAASAAFAAPAPPPDALAAAQGQSSEAANAQSADDSSPQPPNGEAPAAAAAGSGDEDEDEEDELAQEARAIFTSPDTLTLAQIAAANGKAFSPSAPVAKPAASEPEPALSAPEAPAPAPAAGPAPLAFRCARLPSESAPGRPLWHTALFVCDSFLKKENFELVKKHWQGSHSNGQKKTGLYSIDALQDLHAAGNAISLDGLLASPAHTLAGADGARPLDAETFALHAFHQSAAPQAQAIAARAKREMIWSRLGSLLARMEPLEGAPAAFEPARLFRDEASRGEGMGMWVDAARGIVKTQQWSDASDSAELVDSYRHSADARVMDRLAALTRQMSALPEADPPAPEGESLYMTPFKAADISSKKEWKANQRAASGQPQTDAAERPARAKMSA